MSNQENANPEERKFLEDHIEEVIGVVCKGYKLIPGAQYANFDCNCVLFSMTEDPLTYTMWNRDPIDAGNVTNAVLQIDTAPKQLVKISVVNYNHHKVIADVCVLIKALVNTELFTVMRISNFGDLLAERDNEAGDMYERTFIMEVLSTDYRDLIQNKH